MRSCDYKKTKLSLALGVKTIKAAAYTTPRLIGWLMKFLHVLLFFSFTILTVEAASLANLEVIPFYIYNMIKLFIILPIIKRIHARLRRISLLPEDVEHFDAFGNFIGSTRDLLENDEICERMLNYTEKFKNLADNLYKEKKAVPKDGWTDPEGIFNYPKKDNFYLFRFDKLRKPGESLKKKHVPYFNKIQFEESSERWAEVKRSFFCPVDVSVEIKEMPKTFSFFRYIDVPLRSRFAIVLESYLIDLVKLFYPFLEGSKLTSFEDLLALVLFYLYVYLDEDKLALVYTFRVISDLKEMGTILKLPKQNKFNRVKCLKMLLDDVLKYELYFTFNLFLSSKIVDFSSSNLIKTVLLSKQEILIMLFLKEVNRNARIFNIADGYDGNLCHAVYWSQIGWLFEELLTYKDVDWNSTDSRGYTVLGYMINDTTAEDERYRILLRSTRNWNICYLNEGIQRNVLEECLNIESYSLGMSRFVTFLNLRNESDDFGELLISAALHNRPDYFDLILSYRRYNSCHELDNAFQLLFQHMGMENPILFGYLQRMLVWGREWHGSRGNKLEHLYFMKWELQLARWTAAADEMGMKIFR